MASYSLFKVDRLQLIVVAKNLSVLQLFISRMPKMCAILQLVSAPLNPIPIAATSAVEDRSLGNHFTVIPAAFAAQLS